MDSYIDEHKTLFVVDKNGYILKMIENYTKHDNCRTCDIEDNGMNFYIERGSTKYLDCKNCRNYKRKTIWSKNKKKCVIQKGSFIIKFS